MQGSGLWRLLFCNAFKAVWDRLAHQCIILEERSQMNKKILDAVITFIFCICLIATTNIQERNAAKSSIADKSSVEDGIAEEERYRVAAGVSCDLSRYSFTTESDEKTGIEKKQKVLVAAPEGNDGTLTENHRNRNGAAAGDEVVPAGLAEPVEAKTEEAGLAEPAGTSVETGAFGQQEYHNRWNITLTKEEIDLLARIVWLESCGEPQRGQEAVVEVVFNRIASEQYPNTLYDVLSQQNPVQFCSWKNRNLAEPTEKEYQSIYQVLNGNTDILRNDTLYFSTEPLTPRLDVKIGGHSFCY